MLIINLYSLLQPLISMIVDVFYRHILVDGLLLTEAVLAGCRRQISGLTLRRLVVHFPYRLYFF
jgi:hypothetical protein